MLDFVQNFQSLYCIFDPVVLGAFRAYLLQLVVLSDHLSHIIHLLQLLRVLRDFLVDVSHSRYVRVLAFPLAKYLETTDEQCLSLVLLQFSCYYLRFNRSIGQLLAIIPIDSFSIIAAVYHVAQPSKRRHIAGLQQYPPDPHLPHSMVLDKFGLEHFF